MDKFIKLKENQHEWNVLHIRTYYDLGHAKERGYYLVVQPEKHDGVFISIEAFSGCYLLLKSVCRKSKSAEQDAERLAEEKEKILIDYVLNKHGLEMEV